MLVVDSLRVGEDLNSQDLVVGAGVEDSSDEQL
jgi:hypothetical protein